MSHSSFDAERAYSLREAQAIGYKRPDQYARASQRAKRSLTPRQRRIQELRDLSTWQPLGSKALCELRRLVAEEQAER